MKHLFIAAAFLCCAGLHSGCTPHLANSIARTAFITAAVVGTAQVVAHHSPHYHHLDCGCPHYYHEGRWIYNYQGQWEYYDPNAGVWYQH